MDSRGTIENAKGGKSKLEILPPREVEDQIHENVVGQDKAVRDLAMVYVKIRFGVRPSQIGVLDSVFLAGPSGVGKTESVLTLARMLMDTLPDNNIVPAVSVLRRIEEGVKKVKRYPGETDKSLNERQAEHHERLLKNAVASELKRRKNMGAVAINENDVLSKIIKIDGGNFQHGHEIATILGPPHGYIGFVESKGLLHETELAKHVIRFRDFSGKERQTIFILLDEAEKGHERLHNAFLTILDKGRLTLGDNSISDLSDAVIFFTSNVGSGELERSREHTLGFQNQQQTPEKSFVRAFKGAFRPEYRGRINRTIVFENLKPEHISRILSLSLKKTEAQFAEQGTNLTLEITPAAREILVKNGYNLSEGVRALKKILERQVFDKLILAMQHFNLDHRTIVIDVETDGSNKLEFYFGDNVAESGMESAKAANS